MNELQTFENSDFGSVRILAVDNVPYFVGKDITDILGYTNSSKAIADHVDSEDKLNNESLSSLGQRGGWLINESGLYSLILSSKMPGARKFKHWVTSDVLPSIRKHGMYATDELIANPDLLIAVATELKNERERRSQLEKQAEIDKPKVEFFNSVADSKTAISMNEVAKVLSVKGYGRNNLFEFLRNAKVLDRWNTPYQRYIDNGWFRVIEQHYMKNGEPVVTTKTLVYQKGVDGIRKMITKGE